MPAALFADLIAEDLGRVAGRSHRPKIFRIYRDLRFSQDKTPLNTHLHVMWSDQRGNALTPAWFFGLSTTYFLMGTGIIGPKGADLTRFRAHADTHGDDLRAVLDAGARLGVTISDWGPEPLKRVPKSCAPDHP